MSTFTVVITAIDPGRADDVAAVVPLTMAASTPLPIVAARGVAEAEAEALFHSLRQAGAHVRLDPVRSSSAPSSGPRAPSSRPPSTWPSSSRPPSHLLSKPPSETLAPRNAPAQERSSFLVRGLSAYLYPAKPGVALAAAMTMALSVGIELVTSFIPIMNIVGMLISLGLRVMFLSAVLLHASDGRDGAPKPTVGDDLWSFIVPGMRIILTIAVPLILLFGLAGYLGAGIYAFDPAYDASFHPAVTVALCVWLVYLPISLILVAHGGHWLSGLNVIQGGRLIARFPVGYSIACALLAAGIAVFQVLSIWLAPALEWLPFGGVIMRTLTFFLGVTGARILGLLLHHYEDKLGY